MGWMCNLCFHDGKEIGEIAPGYSLIYNEGKYYILGGQGHRDDEELTFETTPTPDPDPDCVIEDYPRADDWLEEVDKIDEAWKMHPTDGYAIVNTCREQWQTSKHPGRFSCWLYDKCGRMIQEYNQKHSLDQSV